ncbi:SLC25A12_13 [Lepeophtheirus salmonis]|uniref:SLC25A12_13 n=1 Tax=Lepeophtheirus salmonis TaxID=72036 RepID=A0A7R8H632_LEPSM|nr:SLC25A12_13 [Lepeophtheirus salmonis]CAF2892021.1 SLC25A12_13 [Lepeophtheirus salmonis]
MDQLLAGGLINKLNDEQAGYLKRADQNHLKVIFEKYSTGKVDGEAYMTDKDFLVNFLDLLPVENFNKNSARLLCGILDTSKDGLISFEEFSSFESSLCVPDALYRTAFQLFDTNGNGTVSYVEFCEVIRQTTLHKKIPFTLESEFIKLYFGKDGKRAITYTEFSQFLHDFHEEYATVAFKCKDAKGTGFISSADFKDIMVDIKSHLLTDTVKNNLLGVGHLFAGESGKVSYPPFFVAFISLLSNIELIKKVYLNATSGSRVTEVSKEEFMHSAQMMSQITPLEIDILFKLCDLLHNTGRIMYSDLQSISPEQYMKQITKRLTELHAVSKPEDRGIFIQILECMYRFGLGSIAGAIGATTVYPIDLVKTRMQNQRTGSYIGELIGLLPQLMGVAPEKAIKLTVNDFVRDKLTDDQSRIPLWGEVLAGGSAGASQVMFTNPLEIVKIRLQVAGEIASSTKVSAWSVVKDLGFFGLYKGSRACLLRDVPFSAIFFPAYAHLKPKFADDNGYNSPLSLLIAGAISGVPAATLVTPADVIKTRLQRKEEELYGKGAIARMCRSSPQFGVTLLTYEILQRMFYVNFGGTRPTGSEAEVTAGKADIVQSSNPDHIGGYRVAVPIFSGIESKFGLVFPKFETRTSIIPLAKS